MQPVFEEFGSICTMHLFAHTLRLAAVAAVGWVIVPAPAAFAQGCNSFGSYSIGPDVEITCVDSCVTLTAPTVATVVAGGGNAYTVSDIPYVLPYPFSQGNVLPALADDVYSSAIPIGFPFQFYGTTYSNVWVSTNGYIMFSAPTGGFIGPRMDPFPIPPWTGLPSLRCTTISTQTFAAPSAQERSEQPLAGGLS
jgi:hypothetical protein